MKSLNFIKKYLNKFNLFYQKTIFICDDLRKKNYHFFISIFVFFLLFFFAFIFSKYKYNKEINDINKLQNILNEYQDYKLYLIRSKKAKIPRVFIKYFPKNFNTIKDNLIRKSIFIKTLLPLILQVNEEIIKDRNYLLDIKNKISKKIDLTKKDLNFLYKISKKYKVNMNNLDELINRVDKIPVSLALAQSIQETGWGSSYFLLNGNSLFAEWTWKYDGMIPRDRDSKLHHRIKTFSTLIDSVRSYALILNSSKYYKKFRSVRKKLNEKGYIYSGLNLGNHIKHYSTTEDYLFFVKKIIIENSLTDFDNSTLE